MSNLNIYDRQLIEQIEHSDGTRKLKDSLMYMVENAESSIQLERELVNAILKLEESVIYATERLVYAEAHRTHPKDILVVGDTPRQFLEDESIDNRIIGAKKW